VALLSILDDRVRDGLAATGISVRTLDLATRRHEIRLPGRAPVSFRCYDRILVSALAIDSTADRVDIAVIADSSALATPVARRAFADALPPGSRVTLATESELLASTINDQKDI